MDPWFAPKRLAWLLLALICLSFGPVLLGQATFFFRDYSLFGYPLAFYHREAFWRGEVPLWNPLNNFGLPFLAQWNTLTLYPPSLLYLLLPLPWSLSFFCLAHLFWGGLGMFWLARDWTKHGFAASWAAVGYAFNGLVLNSLMWPNNIAAFGWLPWVVYAGRRGILEGGRRWVIAVLAAGIQMLSGAPEIILLTWFFLGALALWESLTPGNRLMILGRFLFLGVCVASLAAVQLLPFLDLLVHSQRDTGFGGSSFSLPLAGWANFFVPLVHAYKSTLGVYYQPDQYWTSSYYPGIVMCLFAVPALFSRRRRFAAFLSCLCLFLVWMALGENGVLYTFVKRTLPLVGLMRFPIKFVALISLLLPMVSAMGLAWLARDSLSQSPGSPPFGEKFPARAVIGACLSLEILVFAALAMQWFHPKPDDEWPATLRDGATRALLLPSAAVVFLLWRRRVSQRWMPALVLLLIPWVDLFLTIPSQNPTVAPWVYGSGIVTMKPLPQFGHSRAMLRHDAYLKLQRTAMPEASSHCARNRMGLLDNANLLEGIAKTDGFYSLYPNEGGFIQRLLQQTPDFDQSPLLDFLGVSQVTAPGKFYEWKERPTFLPLITAGQAPIFGTRDQILQAISSPDFRPAAQAYFDVQLKSRVRVQGPARATLRDVACSASRIAFTVEAGSPCLVVIAQTYYPHWRARIDGRPAEIFPVNHAFQAVETGPGKTSVVLEYVDPYFRAGCGVTLGTVILLAGLYGCAFRPKREKRVHHIAQTVGYPTV